MSSVCEQLLGYWFGEVVCIIVVHLNALHDNVTFQDVVADKVVFHVNVLEF